MSYAKLVKDHLSKYKEKVLGIEEKGVFKHNGRELRLSHILPKEKESLNIIETYRDQFYSSKYSDITYHKFFHHLNSSQAFCINFFFPLISENRDDLICELLELEKDVIKKTQFEYESDIELSSKMNTNFDFFIETKQKRRIYIEVKYTEQEFGIAKPNISHIKKFEKTYKPLLENNRFINDEYKEPEQFLKYYQILRNLVHINESNIVIFFYPNGNTKIHRESVQAKSEFLSAEGRDKLKLITAEEAYQKMTPFLKSTRLKEHYQLFNSKYLNIKLNK